MKRYTEYHAGVAVIKDKTNMKEAMQRFAELEERATPKEPVRIDNAMGGTQTVTAARIARGHFLERELQSIVIIVDRD